MEALKKKLAQCGLDEEKVHKLVEKVRSLEDRYPATVVWQKLTEKALVPDMPFPVHECLFHHVYRHWNEADGPPPAWIPTQEALTRAHLYRIMHEKGMHTYEELHRWSVTDRSGFWRFTLQCLGIPFKQEPRDLVDLTQGVTQPRWLPGAQMNIADACFQAEEASPALVYQRPGGPLQNMTYGELRKLANRVANGLRAAGLNPGDGIAIDMPMTASSVAIYLGIVLAGCTVISIADSFTSEEIAVRLRLGEAKAIFTQDVVARGEKQLPMYRKVTEAGAPMAIVLPLQEQLALPLRAGDLAWSDFLAENDQFESVTCRPDDHANILFSSGTTGDPKAIPWSHTTPIKCAADGYYHQDIHPQDVVAWPTNLGWMMGPWLLFATLVNKGTIALYEDAPMGHEFARFIQDAQVNVLGVVPSLVRTWMKQGHLDKVDWRAVRCFSSTGECSNPREMLFLMSKAGYKPVIEYCGGTEIGGGYVTGTMVQASAPSTFSTPAMGLDFLLLDEEAKVRNEGEVFLIPPSIGLSTSLLNRDHEKVYHQGVPSGPAGEILRRHGDQFVHLGHGYYRGQGRADDTMNLGGIKVGSAELERAIKPVTSVVETAAVAVPSPGGGPSLLIIFAVLENGANQEEVANSMQQAIKQNLNPLFKIHQVVVVDALPRTASGKVMRRVLRDDYLKNPR